MATKPLLSAGALIRQLYDNVPDVQGIVAVAHKAGWPLSALLRDVKREYITQALRAHDWNQSKTAKTLGMHRNTLGRDIAELGIMPNGRKPAESAGQ